LVFHECQFAPNYKSRKIPQEIQRHQGPLQSVLDHGGHAIGVMPKMLDEKEITSQKVSELILVDSMNCTHNTYRTCTKN
jgi:hypothetical protein